MPILLTLTWILGMIFALAQFVMASGTGFYGFLFYGALATGGWIGGMIGWYGFFGGD